MADAKNIDVEVGSLHDAVQSITDEVIGDKNGKCQYVHYIEGNSKNKLIVGTGRKGKQFSISEQTAM